MHLTNFTVYTKRLVTGKVTVDPVKNEQIIDDSGSTVSSSERIYDLYDKLLDNDEEGILVGQDIWKNALTVIKPLMNYYFQGVHYFYFKNGCIAANVVGTYEGTIPPLPESIIATIVSGTGDYLGATGYMEIINLESIRPYLFTKQFNFIFTN